MKNKNYAFLLIGGILGMIEGIVACITIVGAIVGIPLIIGATKYLAWAKVSDEDLFAEKDTLLIWGIVYTILMFPIGAITLIPPLTMDKTFSSTQNNSSTYEQKNATSEKKSKLDRLMELEEMKKQGLIDENDFEIAKKKILSED